jgi:site-specific DNA-adenine methylase
MRGTRAYEQLNFEEQLRLDNLIEELSDIDPSLQRYIEQLEEEIQILKETNEQLESAKEDLEISLSEIRNEYNELDNEFEWGYAAMDFLNYLVQDRYFNHPQYDTLEKVLDKAEFVVHYGAYKWGV